MPHCLLFTYKRAIVVLTSRSSCSVRRLRHKFVKDGCLIKTFTQKQIMLTAVDLRELVPAAKNGDAVAIERLCESFSPLVYSLCHRQTLYDILGEDAENTVWVLFLDGVANFDGKRCEGFPGFISRHLDSRIKNIIKHNYYRYKWEQLSALDGDDDALRVASKDGLSPMLDNLAVEQELALLPKDRAYILEQLYDNNKSPEELSSILKISPRTVRYHRQAGLRCLRNRLHCINE